MEKFMKTGLTSVTFRKLSADEIISIAVEAGIDGVEWGSDVHVPAGDASLAREIAEKTSNAGLSVLSYGSYFFLGAGMDFAPYIESCKALGADVIRGWGGKKERWEMTEEEYAEFVSETRKIGEMAAKAGITVAFEYHGRSITATADDALALIGDVNLPNVRLYWQTVIGMSYEDNLRDLKKVLPYLVNAHAFRYVDGKQQLIGDMGGLEEWKSYAEEIRRQHPDAALIIEFCKDSSRESFLADARTIREAAL